MNYGINNGMLYIILICILLCCCCYCVFEPYIEKYIFKRNREYKIHPEQPLITLQSNNPTI